VLKDGKENKNKIENLVAQLENYDKKITESLNEFTFKKIIHNCKIKLKELIEENLKSWKTD